MRYPILFLILGFFLLCNLGYSQNESNQVRYFRFWSTPAPVPAAKQQPEVLATQLPQFSHGVPNDQAGFYSRIWKVFYQPDGQTIWGAEFHQDNEIDLVLKYFWRPTGLVIQEFYLKEVRTVWYYDPAGRLRLTETYNQGGIQWVDRYTESGERLQRLYRPNRNQTYYYYWGPQ